MDCKYHVLLISYIKYYCSQIVFKYHSEQQHCPALTCSRHALLNMAEDAGEEGGEAEADHREPELEAELEARLRSSSRLARICRRDSETCAAGLLRPSTDTDLDNVWC